MSRTGALPFFLRRSHDVIGASAITSTEETVHGLVRIDPGGLVIQWRVGRRVDHIGSEIRTDNEIEPVREVVIPLGDLAAACVRFPWWSLGRKPRLVLTAADLRAFETVAGEGGLRLGHPAELVLRIRAVDRVDAEDFAGELELALAEETLRRAESGAAQSEIEKTPEGPRLLHGGEDSPC